MVRAPARPCARTEKLPGVIRSARAAAARGTHIIVYPLHILPPFAPPSLLPVLELCVVQRTPPLFDTTQSGVPTQVMTARLVNDHGEPLIPILIHHTLS